MIQVPITQISKIGTSMVTVQNYFITFSHQIQSQQTLRMGNTDIVSVLIEIFLLHCYHSRHKSMKVPWKNTASAIAQMKRQVI